ncbi:P-loop NTPase family protein [Arenimonas aestuarii]
MKVLVFGNSGSGKSTFAAELAQEHGLAHLDLDAIVWEPGKIAVQRPADAVAASLSQFLSQHGSWVIEGCYGELVAAASSHCTELVFLNPGLETCLENNRRRPWEPHKYASKAAQDSMLDNLQAWVSDYYDRQDQWSYHAHRQIFDAFAGRKSEHVGGKRPTEAMSDASKPLPPDND